MMQAAIDLGTVTSRLMIGEVCDESVKVFSRSIAITNLGEGLAESGYISDTAYARLLSALLGFREDITDAKTQMICEGRDDITLPVKIIATSAMRDASNAQEILDQLDDLGFEVEVISGNREAELSFRGTLSGFFKLPNPVLSIDVGGGSTELILGTHSPHIISEHSFDIGSRRVTELFLKVVPPSKEELMSARTWIEEQATPFFEELPGHPEEVLAVAGTATSAITIRDAIAEFESSAVHGKRLTQVQLRELIERLCVLDQKQLAQVTGLHPGRAPVIVGGLMVLSVMLAASGRDSLLVSDTDILQGIILDEFAIC